METKGLGLYKVVSQESVVTLLLEGLLQTGATVQVTWWLRFANDESCIHVSCVWSYVNEGILQVPNSFLLPAGHWLRLPYIVVPTDLACLGTSPGAPVV